MSQTDVLMVEKTPDDVRNGRDDAEIIENEWVLLRAQEKRITEL